LVIIYIYSIVALWYCLHLSWIQSRSPCVHSQRTFSFEVQHVCGCCKWLLRPVKSDNTFQILTHI